MTFEYFSADISDEKIINSLYSLILLLEKNNTKGIHKGISLGFGSIKDNFQIENKIDILINFENLHEVVTNRKSYTYFKWDFRMLNLSSNCDITIIRKNNLLRISHTISYGSVNQKLLQTVHYVISQTEDAFKKLNASGRLEELLGTEYAAYQLKRESELQKLEALTERNFSNLEDIRKKYNEELIVKERELREKLGAEYEKKNKALEDREREVQEKYNLIDTTESKQARRNTLRELKKEIKAREQAFTLTKDTLHKRWPVHILFSILILIFGCVLFFLYKDMNKFDLFFQIKFGTTSLVLSSVIYMYIRWNDSWFKRHAEEEFKLKQFNLDLDRASWVVELIMEFKVEEKVEIPDNLIDKLTVNLFENSPVISKKDKNTLEKFLLKSRNFSLNLPQLANLTLSGDEKEKDN